MQDLLGSHHRQRLCKLELICLAPDNLFHPLCCSVCLRSGTEIEYVIRNTSQQPVEISYDAVIVLFTNLYLPINIIQDGKIQEQRVGS